ncbi:hypothetical protein [Simkania sp.]|uniref:hypothetical protein n=1 Tax=Simkania sp. TaxID=34094 RepID=UPI003B52C489
MNNSDFNIDILDLPDRENLVAEIDYKQNQWAEISAEIPNEFVIQFYSHPEKDYWEFPFDEAMEILQKAKDHLAKLQRSPEEQRSYDEWLAKLEHDFNKELGIMSLEERREIYPPFLVREMEQIMENPKLKEESCEKVTDFLHLMRAIWVISSQDYQERYWIRKEPPMEHDNFEETTVTLIRDGKDALRHKDVGHIEMPEKQYTMLKSLCDRVEAFKSTIEKNKSDQEIISNPKWGEIREYAKLVYQEITGEIS